MRWPWDKDCLRPELLTERVEGTVTKATYRHGKLTVNLTYGEPSEVACKAFANCLFEILDKHLRGCA